MEIVARICITRVRFSGWPSRRGIQLASQFISSEGFLYGNSESEAGGGKHISSHSSSSFGPTTRATKRDCLSTSNAATACSSTTSTISTRSRAVTQSKDSVVSSTLMDPTPEAFAVSASTTRGRRGKNLSNQNSDNKDNTNLNKGKEKEHESRVRDRDKEIERSSGLNINSHVGDDDDNDSEEGAGILQQNMTKLYTKSDEIVSI
ncbi:E3 ubiquitin-protein ligase [Forsythia ovata]|uniref:E3 ubiquitin-protein ligase n=1 Tax=Forsythia ovata TaxID=205694 RepID=A0ABD1TRG3_9LAMI